VDRPTHQLDQALSLYDGHLLVALGNWAGSVCGLLILVNASVLPGWYVLLWFGAFSLHTGLSLAYRLRVRREDLARPRVLQRWLRASVITLGSLGFLWAAMFVPVMLSRESDYQFAVLAGGAMLGAGAMASIGAHLPTYRAFFLLMFPPVVLVLFMQTAWLSLGMGGAALLFLFFMLWSGHKFNADYLESLRLRDENLALVGELRVQKDAAEQAAQAKSRFLAAASHDLRQPMYALNLYHGAMANVGLPAEAASMLAHAQQCASAMDGMFAVLLDMSRLDAGVVQPAERAFAVADMLERLRIEFTPPAQDRGLTLRVRPSQALIRTDPALAERMLRNLLTNALRYTPEGCVLLGCRTRGDRVEVVVADTGVGIPADQQSAIFEEYVQLGNPERDRTKGLGLGLAIVQRLSRLLGAPVAVRSVPGRGALFSVSFARADAVEPVEPVDAGAPGDLRGRWVVVVDDEGDIREAARHLLGQWGCEVTVAAGGDEAVARLAMSPRVPDLILCDYRLRDNECGLDAIEKLRGEFCEDIPALLVTGDTAPDRIVEIKASGIPMLHKPVRPEALRQALWQLLPAAPDQPDQPDQPAVSNPA